MAETTDEAAAESPPATMSVRAAATWALASQYTAFIVQFGTSVLLARLFISPAQLGLFSIAFAAVSLIGFLQDFGVTRFINGERDLPPERLHMAYTVSVGFAWTIAVVALLAAGPIAAFYGDPHILPVARIIAASYLMLPLAIVPQATCQRRMDYRSNSMIEVSSALANAAVAITLAMRGYGAEALAWGAFAQQAARLVVSQWRAGLHAGHLLLPWPLRLRGAGTVMQYGATNSVLAICSTLNLRLPELVIGRLLSNAAVGLFSRAAGLALQLRLLVAGPVTGVFYPAFRRVRDAGDPLGPPYLRVVAAYTGVTWAAMAGIAALAGPLIATLYGPKWMAAAPLLQWIALAELCMVAVPLTYDLPLLFGQKARLIRRNLLETALAVVLIASGARFGLYWVALARFIHGLAWIALYAPFMTKMMGIRLRDLALVWARSLITTLAAVAPLLASYALIAPPETAGLVQLVLAVLLGMGLWLAALALTGHALLAEILDMTAPIRARLLRSPAAVAPAE